jgi:hypothetical protein
MRQVSAGRELTRNASPRNTRNETARRSAIHQELSTKTWRDFERLFSQGGGWDFCWCMHFHRARGSGELQRLRTRAEKGARDRKEKKELVEARSSHGVLVYADGEPVGWCQYGTREGFRESTTPASIEG